jgi:hypothetical protein
MRPQQAADPRERVRALELRRAAGPPRRDGEAVDRAGGIGVLVGFLGGAPMAERRRSAREREAGLPVSRLQHERRGHGQVVGGQFAGEVVLLQDLRVVPAPGPVELGHHGVTVVTAAWTTRFS